MKNIIYLIIWTFLLLLNNTTSFAAKAPWVNCVWLPWCPDKDIQNPTPANVHWDFWSNIVWKASIDLVITFIQYIWVIAVISLMLWWVMYILSGWEDEKIKKAKAWIIWSMVWVFMSVSAWWIISFIAKLNINLL